MQWWNDFVDWVSSDEGWRIISGAIIPFLAIIIAGIIAAGIGRASTRRVVSLSDRDVRIAAVTALLAAARRASVWNTLGSSEQQHADQMAVEAEIRLRLLSVPGASLASDWTAHEIVEMKKNSVSFSFQAEQSLLIVRDRLIEWQARPARAKKLFKNDLDSWAYESSLNDQDLVHQQQAWAAQQTSTPSDSRSVGTATTTAPTSVQPAVPAAVTTPTASTPERYTATPATASASTDATEEVTFARPVTASEASKRIAPQDDITP